MLNSTSLYSCKGEEKMKKIIYTILIMFAFVSCSSSSETSTSESAYSLDSAEYAFDETNVVSEESPLSGDAVIENENENKKIKKTGTMYLNVENTSNVMDQITKYVEDIGGYISSSSTSNDATVNSSSASMEIKVPNENFDDAINEIKTYGKLTFLDKLSEDITEEYSYTSSYLDIKNQEYIRLLELSQNEGLTVEDKIEIEKHIATVRYDLSIYKSKLSLMDSQLQYSTITLSLYENNVTIQLPNQNNTLAYFKKSINFTSNILEGLCMLIVFMAPPIIVLSVFIGLPLFVIIKLIKRKK